MALQKLRNPKIRRLSVVDQVSDSIKQSLLDQVWKEGDKLPSEGELAEYYGVNRLSVRMALQKLSTLGLIETRVGEGSFVAHFSVQPIFSELAPLYDNKEGRRDVEQLRNLLEGECTNIAIISSTEEDRQKLKIVWMNTTAWKQSTTTTLKTNRSSMMWSRPTLRSIMRSSA